MLCLFLPLYSLWGQEWTKEDSLRLSRVLEGGGELLLNPEAVGSIRFERSSPELNKPMEVTESPAMKFNEELPGMEKPPRRFTLRPYNPKTKYNEDPILAITGSAVEPRSVAMQLKLDKLYSAIMVGNIPVRGIVEKGTSGPEKTFTYAGVGVGGLDLMAPFTKAFWKRKHKGPHAWETYGDSTTVLIREPVFKMQLMDNK